MKEPEDGASEVLATEKRKERHSIRSRTFYFVADGDVAHGALPDVSGVHGSSFHFCFDGVKGNETNALDGFRTLTMSELSHVCEGCQTGDMALCDAPGEDYKFEEIQMQEVTESGGQRGDAAADTSFRLKRGYEFLANGRHPGRGGDWVMVVLTSNDNGEITEQLGSSVVPMRLLSGTILTNAQLRRPHVEVHWPVPATKEFLYSPPSSSVYRIPVEKIISLPFRMCDQARSAAASSSSSSSSSASSAAPAATATFSASSGNLVLPAGILQAAKSTVAADLRALSDRHGNILCFVC